MQKDLFDRIISFLHGALWSVIIFGTFIIFKTFLFLGLVFSLFITTFFIIISLFFILLLDALSVNRKRLQEDQKQTEYLEKISSKDLS